jgi:hypothetical protein
MAILIVVRRTAGQTFQHIQTTLGPELRRDVTLIWDRRIGDRRRLNRSASVERRARDRRVVDVEPLFLDARRWSAATRPNRGYQNAARPSAADARWTRGGRSASC